MALATALQCCMQQSGRPCDRLCGTILDLQEYMGGLVWIAEEDILADALLDPSNDLPTIPPTLEEETALLSDPQ